MFRVPDVLQQRPFSFCSRCSCSIFQGVKRYRQWRNVNPIDHKAVQKKAQGIRYGDHGQGVDLPGRTIFQAIACSRRLSPRCGFVVALCPILPVPVTEQFHDQCVQRLISRVSY
jgi:hypothetical protein